MLVLRAWSACLRNSKRKPVDQVAIRSKLGGNTLGLAELPNQQDMVATLRNLQRQAHRILKHASRPHKHVRLFAQDFELTTPKFAFRAELDAKHAKLVSKKLASCLVLDVMYGGDDMDQYAISTLAKQYAIDFDSMVDGEDIGGLLITPKTTQTLLVQPEMEVWARRHKVELLMTHGGFELQALGDLSVFPHLKRISVPLSCNLSWDVGQCKLKWARVHPLSDIAKLAGVPSFHHLVVQVAGGLPLGLERLTQLKQLRVEGCNYKNRQCNWIMLANLTNLENLDISGNFGGRLPLEICQLTRLTSLRIVGTQFVGNVPTELARLTRLDKLELTENKRLTNIPPCVLQIAALRSVCLDKALLCDTWLPSWEISKRSNDYLEYRPIILHNLLLKTFQRKKSASNALEPSRQAKMAFQGSRSAEHRHLNPVRVEKSNKKKKKENPANPIELHGVFSTPLNFRLVNKKSANNQVCLSYWTPNNSGGHSPNEGTIVLKYVYTEPKTNRTFVYTKDGTKYFLAKANAYFNPNFKSASDPFELTKLLTCLTDF